MKFLFHCSQILREPKNCKKGTQTQRGPNFERKGDQKGTFFDVKGDPKFDFFQNCSQRANMLKWSRNCIKKFQRWLIFTCRTTSWAQGHFYFFMLNGLQMIRAAILLRSLV